MGSRVFEILDLIGSDETHDRCEKLVEGGVGAVWSESTN
jgi:hypothetical protein